MHMESLVRGAGVVKGVRWGSLALGDKSYGG